MGPSLLKCTCRTPDNTPVKVGGGDEGWGGDEEWGGDEG